MELKEAAEYLKTAPRQGRPDFGKTVLIPEAMALALAATMESAAKRLQRKPTTTKRPVRGAEPE